MQIKLGVTAEESVLLDPTTQVWKAHPPARPEDPSFDRLPLSTPLSQNVGSTARKRFRVERPFFPAVELS